MSVYDINASELTELYSMSDNVTVAYDLDGKPVFEPYIDDRLLIFEDNFTSINPDAWTAEVGAMRGLPYFRENNISIENGKLVITIKKENHVDKEWTSGSLITRGKKSWMYGRLEAKIKTDIIAEFNKAFWFLGNTIAETFWNDDGTRDYKPQRAGIEHNTGWSECGEIDVLETQSNVQRPTCNLWNATGQSIGGGTFPTNIDTTEWHIYAMEWTPEYISMSIDKTEYKRWTFSDYSYDVIKAYKTEPQSILFGIGINEWILPQNPHTEGHMWVDWVRVYAEEGVTAPIIEQSISIQSTMRLKRGYVAYTAPVILPLNTSDRSVIWSSDNTAIVRCENGFIYGIALGETDIHVTSKNGLTATCHVTVINPDDPVILT